jgi:hypothetical protein
MTRGYRVSETAQNDSGLIPHFTVFGVLAKASFVFKGRFLKLFWYDAHPSKYFDTADKF